MESDKIVIDQQTLNEYREILDVERQEDVFGGAERNPIIAPSAAGHKSVIMLALSVYLGRNGHNSVISYTDTSYAVAGRETAEYIGAYQLEVIPKYIMNELISQDVEDVEFIILETEEVRTPQEKAIMLGDCQYVTVDQNGDERNPTEAEFFVQKMIDYVKGDLGDRPNKIRPHFVEYHLSDMPRQDMPNLIDLVRRETGFDNTSVEASREQNAEIYIDIHGGPRATQQLLVNLLSILGEEGVAINPDNILTVDGKAAPITRAGESYRVNDFVSGIHEFVNYGRMQSLNRFYDSDAVDSSKSERLRRTMQSLSSAIQVCDMSRFDGLLTDLATELTQFKSDKKENKSDYLYPFLDLIVQGYAPLIYWNGERYEAMNDAVAEIKWCRAKGLYQQMLTLCEARIPLYLRDHNVLDFADAVHDGRFSIREGENEKSNGDEQFLDAFNYFVTHYASHLANSNTRHYMVREKKIDMYYYVTSTGNVTLVDEFMRLHCDLKKTRNNSNHALDSSDNRTAGEHNRQANRDNGAFIKYYYRGSGVYKDTESLDKDVELYLQDVEELIERGIRLRMKWTRQIQSTFDPATANCIRLSIKQRWL